MISCTLHVKVRWISTSLVLTLAMIACSGRRYLRDENFTADTLSDRPALPVRVTAGVESNFAPMLSPNGAYVFYTSDKGGDKNIWEKRSRGGSPKQLTYHSADDFSPALSPDASKIVFVSRRADAAGDIHVMDLDFTWGTFRRPGETYNVRVESPVTEDRNPAWFPDSDRIVFAARKPGAPDSQLMLANVRDGKAEPLANITGDYPAVDAEGERIVFVSRGAIYTHHLETKQTTQLTSGRYIDGHPSFSNDGRYVYFVRHADDTNADRVIDTKDNTSIWRIDVATATAKSDQMDLAAEIISLADFSAYYPRHHAPFVYFALQQQDSLDIFRIAEDGQNLITTDFAPLLRRLVDAQTALERIYLVRRARATLHAKNSGEELAELVALEMQLMIESEQWHGLKRVVDASKPLHAQSALVANYAQLANWYIATNEDRRQVVPTIGQLQKLIPTLDETNARNLSALLEAHLLTIKLHLKAKRAVETEKHLRAICDSSFRSASSTCAKAQFEIGTYAANNNDYPSAKHALLQTVRLANDQALLQVQAAHALVAATERSSNSALEALAQLRDGQQDMPIVAGLAHLRMAQIYGAQGKVRLARDELNTILSNYAKVAEVAAPAATDAAAYAERAGESEGAVRILDRAAAASEAWGDIAKMSIRRLMNDTRVRLAEKKFAMREYGAAAIIYEEIIRTDKLNIAANRGMIDIGAKQGKLDQTIERYQQASLQNSTSSERLYFYGYALTHRIDAATTVEAKAQQTDQCIGIIEEAREKNAQIADYHQSLAWLYLQKYRLQARIKKAGGVGSKTRERWYMVRAFFGFPEPDWLNLSIEAGLTAYNTTAAKTVDIANITQNLADAYYYVGNYSRALDFYLKRIPLLQSIPMRDESAELTLYRRAGRSAFHIEELTVAEKLQRRALHIAERSKSDEHIAYSLDALALTFFDKRQFTNAAAVYEKLQGVQRRRQDSRNYLGTKINLAVTAVQNAKWQEAEQQFQAVLSDLEGQSTLSAQKQSEAIQLDISGQASAAKGFSDQDRLALVHSFLAQIAEQQGDYSKAIEHLQKRGALLAKKPEELAIVHNNIAFLHYRNNNLAESAKSYRTALDLAKLQRTDKQEFMTNDEVDNLLNLAHVSLHRQVLSSVPEDEWTDTRNLLDQNLQALAKDDPNLTADVLAQVPAQNTALGLLQRVKPAAGTQPYEEYLRKALGKDVDAEVASKNDDALLNFPINQAIDKKTDEHVLELWRTYRQHAITRPELSWKLYASRGLWLECLKAQVQDSPLLSQQLTAGELRITGYCLDQSLRNATPQRAWQAMQLYFTAESLNVVTKLKPAQRTAIKQVVTALSKGDAIADLQKLLRDSQWLVALYPAADKQVHIAMLNKSKVLHEVVALEKVANKISDTIGVTNKSTQLFLTPASSLFDVDWESSLATANGLKISYLPSPALVRYFMTENYGPAFIDVVAQTEVKSTTWQQLFFEKLAEGTLTTLVVKSSADVATQVSNAKAAILRNQYPDVLGAPNTRILGHHGSDTGAIDQKRADRFVKRANEALLEGNISLSKRMLRNALYAHLSLREYDQAHAITDELVQILIDEQSYDEAQMLVDTVSAGKSPPTLVLNTQLKLAQALGRAKRFDAALAMTTKLAESVKTTRDQAAFDRVTLEQAAILRQAGRANEASDILQGAQQRFHSSKNYAASAHATIDLAVITRDDLDKPQASLDLMDSVESASNSTKEIQQKLTIERAKTLSRLGQLSKATAIIDDELKRTTVLTQKRYLLSVLANAYLADSNYHRAQNTLQELINLTALSSDRAALGENLAAKARLAELKCTIERDQKFSAELGELSDQAKTLGLTAERQQIDLSVASCQTALGDDLSAFTYYAAQTQPFAASGDDFRLLAGTSALALSKWDIAKAQFTACYQGDNVAKTAVIRLQCGMGLAQALYSSGDTKTAATLLTTIKATADQLNEREAQWISRLALGSLKNLEEARAIFEKAPRRRSPQNTRAGFLSLTDLDLYTRLVQAYLSHSQPESAWTALQAMRAQNRQNTGTKYIDAQRALTKGTAIVDYYVDADRTTIWLIKSGETKVLTSKIKKDDLRAQIQSFNQAIENFSDISATSSDLYASLLAPVVPELIDIQKIIIANDAILSDVAFSALVGADGKYFGETVAVTYTTAIGSQLDNGLLAKGTIRTWPEKGKSANKTAFDRERDLLAREGGVEASHIFGTASFNIGVPSESQILASTDKDLRLRDVLGAADKNLTTLSLNTTNKDRALTTQLIAELCQEYNIRNALVPMWRASDLSASALLKRFYREVRKSNNDTALALSEAQRQVRKHYPHPGHWAAYRLYKDTL